MAGEQNHASENPYESRPAVAEHRYRGSHWTSTAGFCCSVLTWGIVFYFFEPIVDAVVIPLSDATLVVIFCLLPFVLAATVFTFVGLSRRKTHFGWFAFYLSFAPIFIPLVIYVFLSTVIRALP